MKKFVDKYLNEEPLHSFVKAQVENKLINEDVFLKEQKKKEHNIKYKYKYRGIKNSITEKEKEDIDYQFTIHQFFDAINISKKEYNRILPLLINSKSKHIYNQLTIKDFDFLLNLAYILYRYSFTTQDIRFFLGNSLSKDTIMKYIKISAIKRDENILKQKSLSIVLLKEDSIKDQKPIEKILNKKVLIIRNSTKEFIYRQEIEDGILYEKVYNIQKLLPIEISSLKKSRIYKKNCSHTRP